MDSGAFWNLMGFILAIFTGIAALGFSVYTFKKTVESSSYSDLDRMYMEILKIGIDNPEFRDKEKTSDYKSSFAGNQLIRYEAYAYMVWNVCETVYDRTVNNADNRITWEPVIHAEMKVHKKWISDSGNHHKFKSEFLNYVLDRKCK